MIFVNLTPHQIHLNDGTVYQPSGQVARVEAHYGPFDSNGICRVRFGEVENLPGMAHDVRYIASAMVAAAVPHRPDVISPATGHPDAVRVDGQIVSVPGFVRPS